MATEVEVRGCNEIDGQVVWAVLDEADYFGVYIGEPGDFVWAADFKHHLDACNWAEEVADLHDLKFYDRTYQNKEEVN